MVGKNKKESTKNFWIDSLICSKKRNIHLKVEMLAKKIKSYLRAQSKKADFDKQYNCFFGTEYQKECDNFT